MSAILKGNHLSLIGTVGNYWEDDNFGHSQVVQLLLGIRSDAHLTVSINSPGGACEDGIGIYNALKARRGKVHVIVEGLAASAGSLIAMAGDRITMRGGSLMMFHEAMTTVFDADSQSLEAAVRQQAAWTNSCCEIYAARSGKTVAAVRELLRPETWLSAQEAIDQGFADDLDQNDVDLNRHAPAFAYQRFERAPEALIALAKARNWTSPQKLTHSSIQPQEPEMSKEPGASHAAARERIKAIMKADVAVGRTELAEHLAYETEMDAEAAIVVMAKAPAGKPSEEAEEWRPASFRHLPPGELNARGLNNGYSPNSGGRGESRLVASMKQRHGAK